MAVEKKKRFRVLFSLFRWALTLAICVGISWALYSFKFQQISAAMKMAEQWPEPSETVEAIRVTTSEYVPTIQVLGKSKAIQQIDLQNELPGKVVGIHFLPGSSVKKNDVIVQLDISEESALLDAAKARYQLAKISFERIQNLIQSRAESQSSLDQAASNLRITKSTIDQLESNIAKKTIRAPFDGTLGLFQLNVGQYLDVNTKITSLIGSGPKMWIDFSLPQFYKGPEIHQSVQVVPIRLHNSGIDRTDSFLATVIARDNNVSDTSRSVQYRAIFPRNGVRPSEMFQVLVPIGEKRNLSVIPSISLQNDTLGKFVYIIDSSSGQKRSTRRKVVVKEQIGDRVFLQSGVESEEIIAGIGGFKLREGMLVNVNSEEAGVAKRSKMEFKHAGNQKRTTSALDNLSGKE